VFQVGATLRPEAQLFCLKILNLLLLRSWKGIIVENNLKALRQAAGLKQEELAARLSIGQAQYSRIERGINNINDHKQEIAAALGIDPAEIIQKAPQNIVTELAPEIPVYGLPRMDADGFSYNQMAFSEIERPKFMAKVDGAYAVLIYGNHLVPRLSHADIVFVNPQQRPAPNTLCIVLVRDGNETFGLVREYVKSGENYHTVQTLEPLEEVDYPAHLVDLHRVTAVRFST
jgi:transcriptional regulator with XRE-family HTH domain